MGVARSFQIIGERGSGDHQLTELHANVEEKQRDCDAAHTPADVHFTQH